jgi:hypothetical protein
MLSGRQSFDVCISVARRTIDVSEVVGSISHRQIDFRIVAVRVSQ